MGKNKHVSSFLFKSTQTLVVLKENAGLSQGSVSRQSLERERGCPALARHYGQLFPASKFYPALWRKWMLHGEGWDMVQIYSGVITKLSEIPRWELWSNLIKVCQKDFFNLWGIGTGSCILQNYYWTLQSKRLLQQIDQNAHTTMKLMILSCVFALYYSKDIFLLPSSKLQAVKLSAWRLQQIWKQIRNNGLSFPVCENRANGKDCFSVPSWT